MPIHIHVQHEFPCNLLIEQFTDILFDSFTLQSNDRMQKNEIWNETI